MHSPKHIVIVAGEESGDLHAAAMARHLQEKYPQVQISGIGGQHLKAAGVHLISDLAQYGVTGITEVLRHLLVIRKALKDIKHHLQHEKPDLLILVDYPGFNLNLAKYAKRILNIKILYYISPQIWAWKAKRIQLIKECVDHMAVILPFEKAIYQQARVPVDFVGHPLLGKIAQVGTQVQERQFLGLSVKKQIIALLPGSRSHEIERHMPVLHDTANKLQSYNPELQFILPIAGTIDSKKIKKYFQHSKVNIHFIEGKALHCMAAADFVIVASGTASLECALLKKPMCIIYKSSFLTYLLASKLIKVKFLGLCNLLSNKMIVPEFLQYDCNTKELVKFIIRFFNDKNLQEHMQRDLEHLSNSLSLKKSERSLNNLIEEMLLKNNALIS
ncbi:MAG: lipid-A-disaccharide synthase [Legionella sp. 40-6]|nr:lipid-A-disaccharide synthase [Legionella sp.]OJX97256.1 MAG: lipid-A-disaccharide synthase [Legionella sp. 40-6]